jgi:hypothetical protein
MAPFDPVQGFAPRSVKFDDRLGKGFDWRKDLPCGANRATVTVKFEKSYPSDRGLEIPVAKVWLRTKGESDDTVQWIAAVLKGPTDTYQLNAMAWLEKVYPGAHEGPGMAPADLSHPTQIDFAWTPDGVVTVNFGGEYVKHVKADQPITAIGLTGSWSKAEFVDFRVGRSGAPDPLCPAAPQVAANPDTEKSSLHQTQGAVLATFANSPPAGQTRR